MELVWDRDTDTVYVSRTHRLKEASPIVHAASLRVWGKELRWAWPRDGNRETLEGAGIALAEQYRREGLNMFPEFAHYLEGDGKKSVSVEAGLMDMLTRMQTGRFSLNFLSRAIRAAFRYRNVAVACSHEDHAVDDCPGALSVLALQGAPNHKRTAH